MNQFLRFKVLTAIQFNRQLQLGTVKIQYVRRTGKLPTKFQIGDLAGAEFLPEQLLAIGLVDT
jgi:hypothetical protein